MKVKSGMVEDLWPHSRIVLELQSTRTQAYWGCLLSEISIPAYSGSPSSWLIPLNPVLCKLLLGGFIYLFFFASFMFINDTQLNNPCINKTFIIASDVCWL